MYISAYITCHPQEKKNPCCAVPQMATVLSRRLQIDLWQQLNETSGLSGASIIWSDINHPACLCVRAGETEGEPSTLGAEESQRVRAHVCAREARDGCDTDPFGLAKLSCRGGHSPNRAEPGCEVHAAQETRGFVIEEKRPGRKFSGEKLKKKGRKSRVSRRGRGE